MAPVATLPAAGLTSVLSGSGLTVSVQRGVGVFGGYGGAGGDVKGGNFTAFNFTGSGGSGGDGLDAGDGNPVINNGVIVGGNGGAVGQSNENSDDVGNTGAGGAGIVGSNLHITNTGFISGGISGDGSSQGDAIEAPRAPAKRK